MYCAPLKRDGKTVVGGGLGTAFLADVKGLGICFLSAGHNFDSLEEVEPDEILKHLNDFKVWFGNYKGKSFEKVKVTDLKEGTPWRLMALLDKFGVRGAIQHDSMRVIFKAGKGGMQPEKLGNPAEAENWGKRLESIVRDDYCVFLLNDKIKEELDNL